MSLGPAGPGLAVGLEKHWVAPDQEPMRPADLVNPRSGEQIWFDGDESETVIWGLVPAHAAGPPLHIHDATDENPSVIRGRLRYIIAGTVHEMGPGDRGRVPRGAPHRFENPYDEEVELLNRVRPGIVHEVSLRLLYRALAAARPNPLALAVAFHDGDSRPASIPLPVARGLIGLLNWLAAITGVRTTLRNANLPAHLRSWPRR